MPTARKQSSENKYRKRSRSSSSSNSDSDAGSRRSKLGRSKLSEVERLAEIERQRAAQNARVMRQKEQEQKIVEEETVKRIEEMVAQRVAEELEKRKDEIETEVLRRVEEAKQIMERQMLEELERRRKERLEEENRREVSYLVGSGYLPFSYGQRNAEFAIDLLSLHVTQLIRDTVATFFQRWRCHYSKKMFPKFSNVRQVVIVNSAVSAEYEKEESLSAAFLSHLASCSQIYSSFLPAFIHVIPRRIGAGCLV